MDANISDFAAAIAKLLGSNAIPLVAGDILERFGAPLIESFPVLKKFQCIRSGQIENALLILKDRMRTIERTVEGERALGFANLCWRYFEVGAKEHRDLKLKMLAGVCACAADRKNTEAYDVELDIFEAVERMHPFDVEVLRFVLRNSRYMDHDTLVNRLNCRTCSFDEIAQVLGVHAEYERTGLAKSILRMNDLTILTLEGGSFATYSRRVKNKGQPVLTSNDEPLLKVRRGDIGVSPFGRKVYDRVRDAGDG